MATTGWMNPCNWSYNHFLVLAIAHSSKSSEDSLGSFYFPPAAFCAEEERKGYQDLLKTWVPNPFDKFVEPAEQVRGGQPGGVWRFCALNCLALSHFPHRNFHRFLHMTGWSQAFWICWMWFAPGRISSRFWTLPAWRLGLVTKKIESWLWILGIRRFWPGHTRVFHMGMGQYL